MAQIDNEKIERFKDANKISSAVSFDFFDANGKYARKHKTRYVRVLIELKNGTKFDLTRAEFESLGDFKISVGLEKGEYN